eukprot:2347454-Pleurochrysis_carterae.AAC.3
MGVLRNLHARFGYPIAARHLVSSMADNELLGDLQAMGAYCAVRANIDLDSHVDIISALLTENVV